MKTLENTRILKESSPFTSYQFGIREEDLSHIFGVLRNQMYSDKILAVIREYSTNAYDAHVVAGIKDTPIRISLPNNLFPEFKVRDYGHGLSEEDVKNVYAWYGCSTKRNDNDTVGQLGFGSKSAFAYGDNFLITSYHNGIKTVYNAVIDTTKKGKISKLHEESMSPTDKTGVEITVPVKSIDFNQFHSKARIFYTHWDVRPVIAGYDNNFYTEIKYVLETDQWKLFQDHNGMSSTRLYALMGNVTYPLNFSILSEKCDDPTISQNNHLLSQFLGRNYNSLVVRFDIGDLEISSSRESLQYSDHTLNNIYKRLNNVIDHIKKTILDKFKDCKNVWDAKVLYHEFFETYGSRFYGFENQVGAIQYNNTSITGSRFANMERWCNVNGYIDDATQRKFANSKDPVETDTVLAKYIPSRNDSSWKVRNCNYLTDPDVLARDNRLFVINDIDKQSLATKCLTELIRHHKKGYVDTAYVLRFTKDGLYDDFVKMYNLENVEMIRMSEVFEKVKEDNKRVRKARSELTRVKVDTLNTRNRNHTFTSESEIDLSADSGYYVPMYEGEITQNGTTYNLSSITNALEMLNKHFVNQSFPVTNSQIYGFNKRVMESKSFKNNKNNWTNLIDAAVQSITQHVNGDYYQYLAYQQFLNNNEYSISLDKCRDVYNELDNKSSKFAEFLNNVMSINNKTYPLIYEVCSYLNVNVDHKKVVDLANTLSDDYKAAISNYPLFGHIGFIRNWRSNGYSASKYELKVIADYINVLDKGSNVK